MEVYKIMKTKTTLIIIAITAIVVCIIVACSLMFIDKDIYTINLNDYVTVEETGRDGYGGVYVSIDYNQLLDDYSNRLSKDDNARETAKSILEDEYLVGYVINNNLKNGDTIQLTWKVDKDAVEKLEDVFDVKLEYSSFTYTVHKLDEVTEVDAFADVRYQRWGTNGNGSISPFPEAFVTIQETGNVLTFPLTVEIENDGNLSNGDVVHMKLSENINFEHLLNTYGIVFVRTEADVVLDGFAE
jgi:hypothetical protein